MSADVKVRLRVTIRGVVQGVGFRPFVHRLARELALCGCVSNNARGVIVDVEGGSDEAERFLVRLDRERPPHSVIQCLDTCWLEPVGYSDFDIVESRGEGPISIPILPDMATCPECLAEVRDATDRRYRYPFTNCTQCGPRFSIIQALPYDRCNTTMRAFEMCERCRKEYEDPLNRRHHAQPNACPDCGPRLAWWEASGRRKSDGDDALRAAARLVLEGGIAAVKGLGGFQLIVDARNETAVERLRERKHRDEKPFALMAPSRQWVAEQCTLSDREARLLHSPQAPIVLLRRRLGTAPATVARAVAPGNPYLGVMLPYTPLHHLLLDEVGIPVVATSGNLAEEPICTDEQEAVRVLGSIADGYLVHDRAIARHADDSVVRVVAERPMIIRRARGYAPLPLELGNDVAADSILAMGAYQKSAVALSVDGHVVVGQHVGDVATVPSFEVFRRSASDLSMLYGRQPKTVVCDAHPDYPTSRHARVTAQETGAELVVVQHHLAHVAACMVENGIDGSALGVAWDGTGFGTDGTIWGGEFLKLDSRRGLDRFERVAHLRTFRLPGGERAVREPRRAALGLLYELLREDAFRQATAPLSSMSAEEHRVIASMLVRRVNSPVTSSAGRLFDAVAAIVGLRQVSSFEGQAAMDLEFAAHGVATDARYPFAMDASVVDWAPMVRAILEDARDGVDAGIISTKFHNTLVEMIVAVALDSGERRVVLSGGCFQNAYLSERTIERLEAVGLRPYWHQRVPPNDGGISLGQIAVAATRRG